MAKLTAAASCASVPTAPRRPDVSVHELPWRCKMTLNATWQRCSGKHMDYAFVSHAGSDKQGSIRPLAHALLLEGVRLWIDRPGESEFGMGFDEVFLRRHGVASLRPGELWNQQIAEALTESRVVLACLSRALLQDRRVLNQELAIGWHARKLLTCIVDDLQDTELALDAGLPDLSRIQAVRVDPRAVDRCLAWLYEEDGREPGALPAPLRALWQPVAELARELRTRGACAWNRAGALARLRHLEIGPPVFAYQVPVELADIFAEHFPDLKLADRYVIAAMALAREAHPASLTDRQVIVKPAELPTIRGETTAQLYWSTVFVKAGMKSRRTTGALLLGPGAPTVCGHPLLKAFWSALAGR